MIAIDPAQYKPNSNSSVVNFCALGDLFGSLISNKKFRFRHPQTISGPPLPIDDVIHTDTPILRRSETICV